tara:strand:+ start:111144 stop:111830 length:687 start_codon:yes stop_codon:yes gene_type:complete
MPKPPSRTSSSQEIARFLETRKNIAQFVDKNPRLLFAIDATASRQPTWDSASHLQQEMFHATAKIAALAVQLCYYRGFREFRASAWLNSGPELARAMGRVHCEGGITQIARVLRHALKEHNKTRLRALVFIGDAVEETPDALCELAGQCGLRGLPLFIFQEGHDRNVESTFRTMARVSGGAWARFDASSASALAALLGAVARYAAGGRAALENNGGDSAKLLLEQLKR